MFLWPIASFSYYMINYEMQFLDGNLYSTTMVSSVSDTFSGFLSIIIVVKFGAKLSMIISYLLAILGSVLYLIFSSSHPSIVPLTIMIAKMGVACTFNIVYVFTAFLFPTQLNATAYGLSNITARTATILAPLAAEISNPYPVIIVIVLSCVGFFAVLLIKEVRVKK